MSKESIEAQESADEPQVDNPCVCLTCKHRRECSDATPTVVICTSYEDETKD